MVDNAEKIVRPTVQTTIRMEADLHEALRDHVHELGKGLSKRERPSIDSVVQDAVRERLSAGTSRAPVLSISTVNEEFTRKTEEIDVRSEFAGIHAKLDLLLGKVQQYGENLSSAAAPIDPDRQMAKAKIEAARIARATKNARNP